MVFIRFILENQKNKLLVFNFRLNAQRRRYSAFKKLKVVENALKGRDNYGGGRDDYGGRSGGGGYGGGRRDGGGRRGKSHLNY